MNRLYASGSQSIGASVSASGDGVTSPQRKPDDAVKSGTETGCASTGCGHCLSTSIDMNLLSTPESGISLWRNNFLLPLYRKNRKLLLLSSAETEWRRTLATVHTHLDKHTQVRRITEKCRDLSSAPAISSTRVRSRNPVISSWFYKAPESRGGGLCPTGSAKKHPETLRTNKVRECHSSASHGQPANKQQAPLLKNSSLILPVNHTQTHTQTHTHTQSNNLKLHPAVSLLSC